MLQWNNKTYVTHRCQAIEVELRAVDGYVLYNTPFAGLIGNAVPSKEELQCVADKVDVMKGHKGTPICWKD